MSFYDQLGKHLDYLKPEEIEKIRKAYWVARNYHSGQLRNSGEEYLIHPIAVARTLVNMHADYQSIIAALLHDTLEDTSATKEEIIANFGETVANLVDGVTKLSQIEGTNKNEAQAQYFQKMLLAMSRDIRVILIKLVDRLHNMQTIKNLAPAARQRMARETLDIYAPIANRLSIYTICTQLEDLAFASLHPYRYASLVKAVDKVYGSNQEGIKTLNQSLYDIFTKSPLKNAKILPRIKHIYGIYKKMLSNHVSFANVTDIYSLCIIVQSIDDCYRALGIVHGSYKPVPGKIEDYIALPKFNGYQSLHTTLVGPYGNYVEIQIRTKIMEQLANEGITAHWLYKIKNNAVNEVHKHTKQWVNKLLEMQQQTSNSIEFFESFKIDLFPDRIYVFTPKGDIIELVHGATVIDFAYAMASKIGNSCVAARINGKIVPLSTILETGQSVAIITGEQEEPNPAWLNFVITAKARNSISQYLKYKDREGLISLGKRLLDKACTDLGGTFYNINPIVFDTLSSKLGFPKISDLYENIALGNHLATLVAYQLIYGNRVPNNMPIKKTKPLLISSASQAAINFASCCYPIPGDEIIGYVDIGHGLDIHTKNCTHLVKLEHCAEKFLPVSWAKDIQDYFRAALHVEIPNKIGTLAKLTQAISQAKVNISNIIVDESNDEHVLLTLFILVKNTMHLKQIKRHIERCQVLTKDIKS